MISIRCLGGVTIRCQIYDREVEGSTPGRVTIKWSLIRWLTVSVVVWHSGDAFHSINEVTVRRAGLVLRWVTDCGQVNHIGT